MKGMLLSILALLSFPAFAHAADLINLAWDECRTSANNLTPSQNDQSTFTGAVCHDPNQQFATKRIVASMKNGLMLINWGGTTVQVNFYLDGTVPLANFWDFSAKGCRNGSVAAPAVSVNASNCENPYRPGGANNDPAGESEISFVDASQFANCVISYQADHVRNTVPINLDPPTAAGGWLVNNIALDDNANDTCAGCAAPVCIELEFVKYFSLTENRTILATELRNWIVVNSASLCHQIDGTPRRMAGGCALTPVRNTTWGQVKVLYR